MGTCERDDEVAAAILRYLAEQPKAMDTADRITQWWDTTQRKPGSASPVARVLDSLVQRGLLEELGNGGERQYGLNRRRSACVQSPRGADHPAS